MSLKSLFFSRERIQSIIGGLLCALISLSLWSAGLMEVWEGKTWDWRASLIAKPSPATDDICLILVDQGSLDWMKETNGLNWPWPREIYSVVVDFCKRNHAKAVAFDVLFTEPSSYGVEDDKTFGKAVADYGRVASAAFLKKLSGSHTAWPKEALFPPVTLEGVKSWTDTPAGQACLFPRAAMPISELTSASAMLCNVQQEPDPDGIYRRARMVSIFDNHVIPSLGLGIYFAGENAHTKNGNGNFKSSNSITQGALNIGNKFIPLDEKGEAILRYRGPSGTHRTYSAAAIIQSEIAFRESGGKTLAPVSKNGLSTDKEQSTDEAFTDTESVASFAKEATIDNSAFKDKYVFFSFSAPGLFDLRSSPVDSVYPGVEIQATMLDNFLAGDFIREASEFSVIIWVFSWTVVCAVCMAFLKGATPLFFAGSFGLALPAGTSIMAYDAGIWLPLVVQEAAAALAILFSLGLNYAHEGRQRRFIKNAFSQYLSPVFIEQLIQHPEKLKLGGERKELSIFFSDLQGFTSISEKLSPEKLTSLLNNYLSAMTEIIHEEGGTVDKYEGDAIIAFWNAPLDVPDHGVCAVRAGLRCQNKLAQMRPDMKKIVGTDMRMRIGLNTGVVVVGNMGSHSRFDYTMLGDSVNLAARLEGANKEFGTYTMISDATRKAITGTGSSNDSALINGEISPVNRSTKSALIKSSISSGKMSESKFAFREIARLAVVGKKEAITVFEPMFFDEFESNYDIYNTYDKGLQLFYSGEIQDAMDIFSLIADRDAPASAYVKKCHELLLENPARLLTNGQTENSGRETPEDWNGVWIMTSK